MKSAVFLGKKKKRRYTAELHYENCNSAAILE